MATKKTDVNEPHDDFKAMPSTMPTPDPTPEPVVPVTPTPEPTLTVTTHDLSPDEVRRVTTVKQASNTLVEYLMVLRDSVHDAEVQRMYSVAITNAETASMWAVRAITYRG